MDQELTDWKSESCRLKGSLPAALSQQPAYTPPLVVPATSGGEQEAPVMDAHRHRPDRLALRLDHHLPPVRYQGLIVEVDEEIQRHLADLKTIANLDLKPPTRTKKTAYQRCHYEPKTFDLRDELYRIFGVDLTNVPGISAVTAHAILCEIGTDVSQFRNASAFAFDGMATVVPQETAVSGFDRECV